MESLRRLCCQELRVYPGRRIVIRRMLTVAGVAAVASVLPAVAASSVMTAWAAPGQSGASAAIPLPSPGEWWLTTWKMRPIVWPLTEGAGVTVAVLDTGVQANAPDLRGVVLPGGDTTGHHSDGRIDFGAVGDGTMMAVLIAGQGHGTGMIGMAPAARILPVVVNTTDNTTADPGAIAAGIVYAANHGAQVIDVAQEHPSGSASGCDPAEQAAVAYAISRDAVVVAAAGDTSMVGPRPAEPASCAGVVSVAAIGSGRMPWPGNVRQPYLTVVNPGGGLITSDRNGRLVTGLSGTRAASALAAGAVALVRAHYPTMPWYQVVQRVTGTALTEGGQVPNESFGYGIFRLSHAINATTAPVPASAPNPVYARYQSWLATTQGQAVSRRLAGSQPSDTPAATAGHGGSSTLALLAILAVLIAAGASAAAVVYRLKPDLAARLTGFLAPVKLSRFTRVKPVWLARESAGQTAARSSGRHRLDPPVAAAFTGLLDPPESQLSQEAPDGGVPEDYLILGDAAPYRIPPYSPAPGSGRDDGLLAPDGFR